MSDTTNEPGEQTTIENAGASDFKTDVAEYSETAAALARLEFRMKGVVYDLTTVKGMDAAKKDRQELRGLYVALDKMRLKLNEDDQARIKKRNDEAKRIDAAIRALFDPIDQQIKAEEQRKEDEKAEKRRLEAERVANLTARIDTIKNFALRAVGKDAAYVREKIDTLQGMGTDDFEEMTPIAVNAKADTLEKLREMLSAAEAHEKAVADLAESQRREAAQREENERLEAEARQRRAAEEQAEQQRQQEARAAEDARREREEKARERTAYIQELVLECVGADANTIGHNLNLLRKIPAPHGDDIDTELVQAERRMLALLAERQKLDKVAADEEERQRKQRLEEQERRQREEDLRRTRLGEIEGIRHQVMIAATGRAGMRKGSTIECMRETLAETEKWTVTEEKFGDLFQMADDAKKGTVQAIAAMIRDAEAREEQLRAEAAMTGLQKVAPGMYVLLTRFSVLMLDERMTQKKKLENLEVLRGQVLRLIGDLDPPHGPNSEYLSEFVELGEPATPAA